MNTTVAGSHSAESSGGRIARAIEARTKYLYRRYAEIIIRKDLDSIPVAPSRQSVVIEQVGPQHHDALLKAAATHTSASGAASAWMRFGLMHEHMGFAAVRDGIVIGYAWYVDEKSRARHIHPHLTRYQLELKPGDCYLYNLFIDAEHRGRGTGTEVMQRSMLALHNQGYRRIWGVVDADNLPARVLYRMLGFQDISRHTCHKILRAFLLMDGRWFIRNRWNHPTEPVDYRPIFATRC